MYVFMCVYIYLLSRHSALLQVETNYCLRTRGPRGSEYESTLCYDKTRCVLAAFASAVANLSASIYKVPVTEVTGPLVTSLHYIHYACAWY